MPNQCEGRRTTPKATPLFFESGPRLHKSKPLSFLGIIPCTNEADGLCVSCIDREEATAYQLEKRAGKYIPNQETMFHGRMTDPIPKWSRLYGGEWFQAQLAAGYTVSEETRRKAANGVKELPPVPVEMSDVGASLELVVKKVVYRKKAVASEPAVEVAAIKKKKVVGPVVAEPVVEPSVEPVAEPVAEPVKPKKRQSKKVVKAEPVAKPVPEPMPEPVAEPPKKPRAKKVPKKAPEEPAPPRMEPMPPKVTMLHRTSGFMPRESEPPPVIKPKRQAKKVVARTTPIIGIVAPTPLEDPTVIKIAIKKVIIDGRDLYVSEDKDKVFDLKFQYLGRWNRKEDRIDTTYPDSDADSEMC